MFSMDDWRQQWTRDDGEYCITEDVYSIHTPKYFQRKWTLRPQYGLKLYEILTKLTLLYVEMMHVIAIHELENSGKYEQNSKLYMLQKYSHRLIRCKYYEC